MVSQKPVSSLHRLSDMDWMYLSVSHAPPRGLREQFLRDVLQELEGVRPDNPGFLKCPLPHAQLSPTAYCSLNMCHSYISMVSFCIFTLCNSNKFSDVSQWIGSGGWWSDEREENMFVMSKGWGESGQTKTHKQKSARQARTFPDKQMWKLWTCGRLHSWL